MSSKENLKINAEALKEITAIGIKAVKRIDNAIINNKTEELNFDAEKILGRDISATVNSIKAEILAYRVIHNKMF